MLFSEVASPITSELRHLKQFLYNQARSFYIFTKNTKRRTLFSMKLLACKMNSQDLAKSEELELLSPPKDSYPRSKEWAVENVLFPTEFSAEFIPLEPDHEVVFDTRPTALERHRSRLFEVKARQFSRCELFVLKLEKGMAWGQFSTVITADHCLLEDLSIDYSRTTREGYLKPTAFRDWTVSSVRRLPGRVAVLTHPASNIYFHWLLEVLPRIDLLKRVGYSLDDFDFFVFTNTQKTFQKQTLSMLGIPSHKIVECNDYMLLQADEMVVPSQLVGHQRSLSFRDWVSGFLCALIDNSDRSQEIVTHPRIYICRGRAKFRKVLNEEFLIERLEHYGFVPIYLEDYSLPEQKKLMASAEVIISPHGSGLTNLVFCQPHTKIIEIFPPELLAPEYCRLSLLMNLDYYYVFGEGKIADDWHKSKNRSADILVDLKALTEVLEVAGVNQLSIQSETVEV